MLYKKKRNQKWQNQKFIEKVKIINTLGTFDIYFA